MNKTNNLYFDAISDLRVNPMLSRAESIGLFSLSSSTMERSAQRASSTQFGGAAQAQDPGPGGAPAGKPRMAEETHR